jgi:hypothetical protein
MPLQPIPKKPVGLSEIPRLPQCISQGDEASPVRIRLRPKQILQFSDVDFLGLSHRSTSMMLEKGRKRGMINSFEDSLLFLGVST